MSPEDDKKPRLEKEAGRERKRREDGNPKEGDIKFVQILNLLRLRWLKGRLRRVSGGEELSRELEEIEKNLESDDDKKKKEASKTLEDLWESLRGEEVEQLTLDRVVGEDEEKREWAIKIRRLAEVGNAELSAEDKDQLYQELVEFAVKKGWLKEDEVGQIEELVGLEEGEIEGVREKVTKLKLENEKRKFEEMRESGKEVNLTREAVGRAKEIWEENREELSVRTRKPFKSKDGKNLREFKKTIEDDFKYEDGKYKVENLSGEEVIERLGLVKKQLRSIGLMAGGEIERWAEVQRTLLGIASAYEARLSEIMLEELNGVVPIETLGQHRFIRQSVEEWVIEQLGRRRGGEDWDEYLEKMKGFWEENAETVKLFEEGFKAVKSGFVESDRAANIEALMGKLKFGKRDARDREAAILFKLASGGKREEFDEAAKQLFGDISGEDLDSLWKQFTERGRLGRPTLRDIDEGIRELDELKEAGNYKEYLLRLISYLSRVGLREGLNDYELAIVMRRARYLLSDETRVPGELVELYDGWVLTEIYGAKYGGLGGMEDYWHLIKQYGGEGIRALKLFLNDKDAREALSLSVEWGSGKERGEAKLSVWRFHEMLTESWLKRLARAEVGKEGEVYDDMVLTMLFGQGKEMVGVVEVDGEKYVEWGSGKKVKLVEMSLKVNGRNMSLEEMLMDYRWMVRTAEHMSNLTLRTAHLHKADFSKDRRINKNIHAVTQIFTYLHTYGIGPAYLRKLAALDGLMYSLENYKGLVEKGLGDFLARAGVETEKASDLAKDIVANLKQKRRVKMMGEDWEWRTNFIGKEDVKFVARTEEVGFEEAVVEFCRRRGISGVSLVEGREVFRWEDLSEEEKKAYKPTIELFQKRLNSLRMDKKLRKDLEETIGGKDGTGWVAVLTLLKDEYGLDVDVNGGLEEFISSMSMTTFADFGFLKPTDLENFGKYNKLMEGVIGIFKGGFGLGTTKSFLEMLGQLSGYMPSFSENVARWKAAVLSGFKEFNSWGLREYMETEEARDYRGRKIKGSHNQNGATKMKRDLGGELVLDENRHITADPVKEVTNLAHKYYNKVPPTMVEWEMMMDLLVNQGVITNEFKKSLLARMYGPRWWRWLRRSIWFDEPEAAFWFTVDSGFKFGGEILKYMFSGVSGQ